MTQDAGVVRLARPFDAHRRAASQSMRDLIHSVMLQLDGYERHFGLRERKRSADAAAVYLDTVDAILCDLVHRELECAGGRVYVSQSNQVLRKKSRYKGRAMGKTLPDILKVMSAPEMGFATLTPGKPRFTASDEGWTFTVKGKQTLMSAGAKLLSRIETFSIGFTDIGRSPEEEIILLRGEKLRSDTSGPLVDYADTEETDRLRRQLVDINGWLEQADIECDQTDTHDRCLRRIFNNADFRQGGRLYGGFWQSMKGAERLCSIMIDDDSTVELDYGQMGLLLLYGLEECAPPSGDLYDLSEYGLPASCRPGIKKVTQAAINAAKPLARMPKGARKTIPKRVPLAKVMEAIRQRHPRIAHRFGGGIGMQIMRLESDILVDVLLTLKDREIVALPVHDAVLVNANYEEEAKMVMIDVFREHTGLMPEVTIEHP